MRRRHFLETLAVTPAAAIVERPLEAQQAPPARPADEPPPLEASYTEQVSDPLPRFFTPDQFAALRRVCDLILPPINGAAGALDARTPEFLDFLLADSPADRQRTYRAGLDALNADARKKFGKPFEQVGAAQADTLLAPLRAAWTYEAPADPLARFLRAAKADIRTATLNSREYINPGGGRRFTGSGLYWHEI